MIHQLVLCVAGLKGFFDIDHLKKITLEAIYEGILASMCILVYLNDETSTSTWCVAEWECARKNGIPFICVVDIDRFAVRPLIKTVRCALCSFLGLCPAYYSTLLLDTRTCSRHKLSAIRPHTGVRVTL